ncbi:PEP-CTERM sorting domain-containing protein [Anabaena sp. UHCC 0253]|uniref:XDD3 family exosortase-dependent surface protein n=1 Tax=Anabaena sp. UHCC 0253 TaxID=2590019 RepID=UPI001448550E|nr:XDD3 family exosortase-dependent surface protein [Anabaena sp. UHCC 0253]MTJ51531.1 PEP-CTERM sorting domain-containing protein [Anabaena sp. UHCC 0253]
MKNLVKLTTVTLSLVTIIGIAKEAQASTLHNGWNYAIDSFNDSTYRTYSGSPTSVGGGTFEIYGLAMKDDVQGNKVTFAINSNLARDGAIVPVASGYSHIGWGDLFIQTASGLLGVNFTDANDSAASLGLYQVAATKSVAVANDGWPTNSSYTNFVASKGGNPNLGDLAQHQSPFGNTTNSVIAAGQWIGNILPADLSGINFGHFGAFGSQTFGFSIERSLIPSGDILAWIFQECFNDGVAMVANISEPPEEPQDVPEPSTLIGMIALAAMGIFSTRNKQKNKQLVVNA